MGDFLKWQDTTVPGSGGEDELKTVLKEAAN
jgi:hypothetical protein